MPRFEKVDPADISLGRGLANHRAMQPFIEAIKASPAGVVIPEEGDTPERLKRLLRRAAKSSGIRVRSSFDGDRLIWKRVGA